MSVHVSSEGKIPGVFLCDDKYNYIWSRVDIQLLDYPEIMDNLALAKEVTTCDKTLVNIFVERDRKYSLLWWDNTRRELRTDGEDDTYAVSRFVLRRCRASHSLDDVTYLYPLAYPNQLLVVTLKDNERRFSTLMDNDPTDKCITDHFKEVLRQGYEVFKVSSSFVWAVLEDSPVVQVVDETKLNEAKYYYQFKVNVIKNKDNITYIV